MDPRDRRLCDLVAASPGTEDLLEAAGIDYWFGGDRTLRQACATAKTDADKLVARLDTGRSRDDRTAERVALTTLLRDLDDHSASHLAPAIEVAMTAAMRLPDRHGAGAHHLLEALLGKLEQHRTAFCSLMPLAQAVDSGTRRVDRSLIRRLRLDHLEFLHVARELTDEIDYFGTGGETADAVGAIRTVVREIHRHISLAYNFVLPRLVAASVPRAVAAEPW